MTDKSRVHIFLQVGIYYAVCFATVLAIALTHPEWTKHLPFGGLDSLDNGFLQTDGVEQLLASNRPISLFDDSINLLTALTGALITMIPMRWVYLTNGLLESRNNQVASGLFLVPMVVTAIVYVVKFSLPLAFALAGIFAGVRYRTSLKNQTDAHFTFACIAVGLAAGTRALGIGLLLATFFSFTMLVAPPTRNEARNEKPCGPL